MILTIKIPDATFETLSAHTGDGRAYAEALLETFKGVDLTDRILILGGADRRNLEEALGHQIEDPKKLGDEVRKMATISIGDVAITLTESQRKRIEAEAKFYKMDPKEYAVKRLKLPIAQGIGN